MLAWPQTMPRPLLAGFTMQPEDRRTSSSEDSGPHSAAAFLGDVCEVSCSLRLNPIQAAFMEKFERDTAAQGAAWFLFPVWYAGALHWEPCRFKARPSLQSRNGFHAVYKLSLQCRRRSGIRPDASGTDWPSSLPAPQATLTYSPSNLRIETDTEVGQIFRRQFDADLVEVNFEVVLDASQAKTFESFELATTPRNKWITKMPLWLGGTLQTCTCLLTARPSWSPLSPSYTRYKCVALVSERSLEIEECILDLLEFWPAQGIRTAGDAVTKARAALNHSTDTGG